MAAAVYQREDGITARYALAYGGTHPDSLPSIGSATWRGGAEITVAGFTDPLADVTLTPRALDPRRWEHLPITGGEFSERLRPDDCIRGGFYGRDAQEAGGVFERGGIVGAFGAERS